MDVSKIPRRRTLSRRATSRTAKNRSGLLFSEEKAISSCSLTYSSVEGWPVCGHGAVGTPFEAGPPGEPLFPCLGTSVSKSSEAALFFPRGEETWEKPPQLSTFMETVIPPVWMCNVWSSALLFFSPPFPEGTWLNARLSILAITGLGEPSGSGAGHLILSALLSQSCPRTSFQNNVVLNINEVFGYRVTYLGI